MAINLIPDGMKLDHCRRKHLHFWLIIVLVCTGTALIWSGVKYHIYLRVNHAWRKVDANCQEMARQVQTFPSTEDLLAQWQDRLALQRQLNTYPAITQVIEYLVRESPELIYLQRLKIAAGLSGPSSDGAAQTAPKVAQMFILKQAVGSETAQGVTTTTDSANVSAVTRELSLSGRALDYQDLADFLEILDRSSLFQDVRFTRTGRDGTDTESIDFEIKCSLTPGEFGQGVDYADLPQTSNF